MNAGTVIFAFPAVYFLYTSKSGTSNSQVLCGAVHDSGLAVIFSESKCYPSHDNLGYRYNLYDGQHVLQ